MRIVASKSARPGSAHKRRAVREQSWAFEPAAPEGGIPLPVHYVESSALLAALLEADAGALALLAVDARRVTSALTFAECHRALRRARATRRITGEAEQAVHLALQRFRRRCFSMPLSDEVLDRAGGAFPVEPVRTLDAVHLASLEVLGLPRDQITVITRDKRVRLNAESLGYSVK